MDSQNSVSQVPSVPPTVPPVPPVPSLEPASQSVQTPPPLVEVPPPANKASLLSKFALFALLFSLVAAGIYVVWTKVIPGVTKKACTMEAKVCPDGTSVGRVAPSCDFAPCPTSSPSTTPDPTVDWETYTNSKYGFQIKYPNSYKIVSDNYGWPKAIFMLYKGGQPYDLVIEVWDKESDYKSKYQNLQTTLVVKEVVGKFIILLNMNNEPEVDQIRSTFQFTN